MDSRLLIDNPLQQKKTFVDFDEDGAYSFRHEQTGITSIGEANEAYEKENPKGLHLNNTESLGKKIGEIPLVVWQELVDRGIAKDPKALRRWLRDPDNRAFRTYSGKF